MRSDFTSLISYPHRAVSGHKQEFSEHASSTKRVCINNYLLREICFIAFVENSSQSSIQLSKVTLKLDKCIFYVTYFAHFQTFSVCNFHTLNKSV